MKRSILSICILLASVSLVFANIYKKYDVRSGLSGNCVRSILQDSIGYMWFATQDGLNRFNGIKFTNYGQLHRIYIRGHFFRTSCLQRDYLFDGKFAGSIMGGYMVRGTGTVQ